MPSSIIATAIASRISWRKPQSAATGSRQGKRANLGQPAYNNANRIDTVHVRRRAIAIVAGLANDAEFVRRFAQVPVPGRQHRVIVGEDASGFDKFRLSIDRVKPPVGLAIPE